jgi:hypothetical protein
MVADHAPSKFPLGPGDEMFGKPFSARRLHSVWTLSKQFRCSLKRVENILSAAGFSLDEQRNGQEALFDVNEAERALERAMQTVSLAEAETHLGASQSIMKVVLAKGFVKRHRVNRGYHGLRFQSDELDSFLKSVMDSTEPVDQNQYNLAHRADDGLIDQLARDGIAYVPFFPLGGFNPLQSSHLSDVAARLGATPMQVALAWLLRRSPNILLILGTSSVGHLRENLAAAELALPDDAISELDRVSGIVAG